VAEYSRLLRDDNSFIDIIQLERMWREVSNNYNLDGDGVNAHSRFEHHNKTRKCDIIHTDKYTSVNTTKKVVFYRPLV